MEMPYEPGTIIEKPWGTEKWIEVNDYFAVREITIKAGEAVSLQYHEKKLESLYVLEGRAIYLHYMPGEKEFEEEVGPGTIMKNVPYLIHRQKAITDFRFIEVTTPELDDIIRLEDKYNRGSHTL